MVIAHFYPSLGGAERQAQRLSESLQAGRVAVKVITSPYPMAPAHEVISGFDVYRVGRPPTNWIGSLRFSISIFWWMLLRRTTYDIVHCHMASTATLVAALVGRVCQKPVVLKLGAGGYLGDLWRLKHTSFAGRVKLELLKRLVSMFVAISEEIRQELHIAGIPDEKIVRLPNGVDTTRFCPADKVKREAIRRELGLSSSPVCLFSGRLVKEKGIFDLLHAWKSVVGEIKDAQLIILGEGADAEAFSCKVKEMGLSSCVRMPGKSDNVPDYLRAADLFVLPTYCEGMSNAVLEAMSTGLAVVATAVGANPEVIRDGMTGILVPARDPKALADALAALLRDVNQAEALGRSGRQRVEALYGIDAITERYSGLYNALLRT